MGVSLLRCRHFPPHETVGRPDGIHELDACPRPSRRDQFMEVKGHLFEIAAKGDSSVAEIRSGRKTVRFASRLRAWMAE